jgi:hypothetical protein
VVLWWVVQWCLHLEQVQAQALGLVLGVALDLVLDLA